MKKTKLLTAFAALLCLAGLSAPASAAIITVIDAQVVADGTPVTHANIRNSVYDDNVTVTSVPTNVTHMLVLRMFDDTNSQPIAIESIAVLQATANNGALPQHNEFYMGIGSIGSNPSIQLQDSNGANIPFSGPVSGMLPPGTFSVTLSHTPPSGFYDPSPGNPQVVEFTAALTPVGGPATPSVMDTSTVALVPEPSVATTLGLLGFLGIFRRRNRRA